MLTHVYPFHPTDDPRTRGRLERAENTWQDFRNVGVTPKISSEKVAEKDFPFLKDMIEQGFQESGDEYIVFTNADTSLVVEAPAILGSWLQLNEGEPIYSTRFDLLRQSKRQLKLEEIKVKGIRVHDGADLFLIPQNWWTQVQPDFPNLLMGCEGWDAVMKWYMGWGTEDDSRVEPPIAYHESHGWGYWQAHRFTSQGNLYNHKQIVEWSKGKASSDPNSSLTIFDKIQIVWPQIQEMRNGVPRTKIDPR